MDLTFRQNIPVFQHGLGVSQISFSGGRVAASIASHGGFTHIDYYGRQRLGCVKLFQADPISAWGQLFRLAVTVDGELYYLEFNDTAISPFGYESRCAVGGVSCRHRLTLLNDALVLELELVKVPAGKSVTATLLLGEQVARVTPAYRTWEDFVVDTGRNAATAVVRDHYPVKTRPLDDEALSQRDAFGIGEPDEAETFIGITADQPLEIKRTPPGFQKIWINTGTLTSRVTPEDFPAAGAEAGKRGVPESGGSGSLPLAGPSRSGYFGVADISHVGEPQIVAGVACLTFAIVFGHERVGFDQRVAELRTAAAGEAAAVRAGFRKRLKVQPQVEVKDPIVQSLLAMAGPVVDSLKVQDLPGAIRAADSGYWVWGWDSMVHSDAMLFAQDSAAVCDMLRYYRDLAHPKLGIPHAITLEGKPLLAMAYPAQCLYAILLYNAYLFTGDRALLAEFYPFAAALVRKAAEQEVGTTGLMRGVSLYPDFPEALGHDGDDLSVFNNSIFYQALRTLAELAAEQGAAAEAAEFAARAARLQASFSRFIDPETGYLVDSLSARDFSPRRHFPVYAILWVTPFARELIRDREQAIAAFMRQHFPTRHGVRLFPRWDPCFYRDGNQLGMYMPVIESFYAEMMRIAGNRDAVQEWYANVAWFWGQLTIPEALTCEMENHGFTMDNPGRKQAFCAKAWYSMFMHAIAGIDLERGGIRFNPADAGDIAIRRFQIRGHLLDIRIRGRGRGVGELCLNGESLGCDGYVSFDRLKRRNTVEIRRRG